MSLALVRPAGKWLQGRIRQAARATLDVLLPPACPLCGDFLSVVLSNREGFEEPIHSDSLFCTQCLTGLRDWPKQQSACLRCAMPVPLSTDNPKCVHCKSWKLDFDRVVPLGMYRGALAEAVVAAKSPHNAALASHLGRLLAMQFQLLAGDLSPDVVTWVPSHLIRKIQRKGTPGVELMAHQMAQRLSIPAVGLLRALRNVQKQALLDDKKRLLNVRGAFALKKSYAWRGLPNLRDRHILLVDDVLTTGATASEIAKVLKQAGASQVTLAVLARAVRE